MNTECIPVSVKPAPHRSLLKRGVLAGAALFLASSLAFAGNGPVATQSAHWSPKLVKLTASGTGTFDNVVGYLWPFGPKADLVAAGLEFRVEYEYPYADTGALQLRVYAIGPLAAMLAGDPNVQELLISRGLIQIDEVRVGPPVGYPEYSGVGPKPTFVLIGRLVANDIPSPFGPIVGRSMAITAGFDGEGQTIFYLLGGSCAGSHATLVTTASGFIQFSPTLKKAK